MSLTLGTRPVCDNQFGLTKPLWKLRNGLVDVGMRTALAGPTCRETRFELTEPGGVILILSAGQLVVYPPGQGGIRRGGPTAE